MPAADIDRYHLHAQLPDRNSGFIHPLWRHAWHPPAWGGEAGTYRTTTRCRDINVRNASEFGTEACVVFVDKTNNCNYWTYLPARSGFRTVATNVREGVNFRIRFSTLRYEYEPLVAYHAF